MFERMVRSTKRCLRKTIGQQRLTYEELSTVLAEIEAVLNNRPLTYLDENDKEEILTPSHLFCGRRTLDDESNQQSSPPTKDDTTSKIATQSRRVAAAVDRFWQRWSKEYLLELRQHHKMHLNPKAFDGKKGDVVLIHEDKVKRDRWNVGVIEEFVVGRDGVIRGAAVRKISGDGRPQLIHRPIQKLYPLEITDSSTTDEDTALDQNNALSDALQPEVDLPDVHPQPDDASNVAPEEAVRPANQRCTTSARAAAIQGENRRRLKDKRN